MATLNGNLGGFKDNKMNCGAGKLISAEHLLLIHGDDCAFCVHSCCLSCIQQFKYLTVTTFTLYVNTISLRSGLKGRSFIH